MSEDLPPLCRCPACNRHVHSDLDQDGHCGDPECDFPDSYHCEHVMFGGYIGGVEAHAFVAGAVDLDEKRLLDLCVAITESWPTQEYLSERMDQALESNCSWRVQKLVASEYDDYIDLLLWADPNYAGSMYVEEWGDCWSIAFSKNPVKSQEVLNQEIAQDLTELDWMLDRMKKH